MMVPIRHLACCPGGGVLSRCSHAFLLPDLRLGYGTECGVSTWRNSLVSDIVPSREQAVACVLSTSTENLLYDTLVSILDTATNMHSLHFWVIRSELVSFLT